MYTQTGLCTGYVPPYVPEICSTLSVSPGVMYQPFRGRKHGLHGKVVMYQVMYQIRRAVTPNASYRSCLELQKTTLVHNPGTDF